MRVRTHVTVCHKKTIAHNNILAGKGVRSRQALHDRHLQEHGRQEGPEVAKATSPGPGIAPPSLPPRVEGAFSVCTSHVDVFLSLVVFSVLFCNWYAFFG